LIVKGGYHQGEFWLVNKNKKIELELSAEATACPLLRDKNGIPLSLVVKNFHERIDKGTATEFDFTRVVHSCRECE